jgi:hypothetical protein
MSEPSTYDTHAPQLLARGFFPLSIGPGTKKPQHFVPSLNSFHDTQGWTHPARRPETSPQPGAGVGVRLGKQADSTYVVALDWDNEEAAIIAMDVLPPSVTKEGKRGFTSFYRSSKPIPSRDFKLQGHAAVQVLSDGRQTVVPPSMHPDIRRPYTWTSKYTLYSVSTSELPALPDDYIEKIESILRPLGYEPAPQSNPGEHHNVGGDDSNPFQELNNLALRNLAAWVPDLNLYQCRRRVGRTASYEAVATWRPSSTGRPLEERKRNLQISGSRGIKYFGTGEGFSPINLVMRARNCSRPDAIAWLQERAQHNNGPEVDFEALTGNGSDDESKADQPAEQEKPKKYRFKLTNYWDMRPGIERPYLVDELIPSKGIVVVWGPPKCMKSFIMLDAMLHVAMGWEFHDRAVQQGPVVYCAFEGGHGFHKRIEAQRRHYNIGPDTRAPMPVMSGMANLINDHKLLTKEIGEQVKRDFGALPAAVVLDTLNRSLQGSESKDTDMANYIAAAEAIREAFQCVVIIVHHCGYDDSRMRGHSSLPGAVDASLAITRENDVSTMTVEYMRDGAEGTQITVRSKKVVVGHDANGRDLTSLVVERFDGDASKAKKAWPPGLKVFRAALIEAILNFGFDYKIPGGPTVKAVDLTHVRNAFYKTYVVESDESTTAEQQQDTRRRAFTRALDKAQALTVIAARVEGIKQIVWLVSALDEGGMQVGHD